MKGMKTAAAWLAFVGVAATPGIVPVARAQETLELQDAIRTALLENPAITRAEANAATAAVSYPSVASRTMSSGHAA